MHGSRPRIPVSNALLRVITALIIMPLVLVGALFGGWFWALLCGLLVMLCMLEFLALMKDRHWLAFASVAIFGGWGLVLAAYLRQPLVGLVAVVMTLLLTAVMERWVSRQGVGLHMALMVGLGLLYLAVPAAVLMLLRDQPQGFLWVMVVMGITAGTDTFAYLGGRWFGRTPLAPRLSPKKTREGALVGWVGGFVIALLFLNARGLAILPLVPMVLLGPPLAVFGDLLESAIKRYFHVKDSQIGTFTALPGHGGVLDRADSLMVVAPFVYVYLLLAGLLV